MPNVALRGVPEPVHRRLKDAARANHRSMNGEILARLAASVSAEPAIPPATPEEIREDARGRGGARPTRPSRPRRSPRANGTANADAPPLALIELASPREGNVRRKEQRLWDAA